MSLINLLTHRQQVTLDTIKNACGIPERTAYRYLRDISEANFPVYYDRDSRAYRLDRQAVTRIDEFNLEETVLILVGLKRLASGLNEEYRQDAEALVKKLLVRQPLPLEEVVEAYEHQLDSLSDRTDCSYLISSLLISAAIRCDKKVRICVDSDNTDGGNLKIDNPALRFKKHWQLVDADGSAKESADFLKIKKVSVI